MSALLAQQGAANDAPRMEIGTNLNDWSTVAISEPYTPNAPQMTGWANQLNLVDPLWTRSDFLSSGLLTASYWEWEVRPTGLHRPKLLSGVVYDLNGAPVSGATVWMFNTATGVLVDTQITASDGSFTCGDPNAVNCMLVAYKAGTPDLSAVSSDALTGS